MRARQRVMSNRAPFVYFSLSGVAGAASRFATDRVTALAERAPWCSSLSTLRVCQGS